MDSLHEDETTTIYKYEQPQWTPLFSESIWCQFDSPLPYGENRLFGRRLSGKSVCVFSHFYPHILAFVIRVFRWNVALLVEAATADMVSRRLPLSRTWSPTAAIFFAQVLFSVPMHAICCARYTRMVLIISMQSLRRIGYLYKHPQAMDTAECWAAQMTEPQVILSPNITRSSNPVKLSGPW